MRIRIDTIAKTIKLEQSAKIVEILSVIKKLLPDNWKEYSLEPVDVINNWYNPITIDWVNPAPLNPQWWLPTMVSDSASTYNIDLRDMSATKTTVN